MELFSFDRSGMLKKFNKLKRDYYSTSNIDEQINLYSQLSSLAHMLNDSSLIDDVVKPFGLKDYYRQEDDKRIKTYRDLREQTEELYFYWRNSVGNLGTNNESVLGRTFLDRDGYFNELRGFFETAMPGDLDLFKSTFNDGRIMVKKKWLFEREEIVCLEALKEFYIRILYCGKLNKVTARNTAHMFGHASGFVNTGTFTTRDFLMEEVMAKLYELLYIDYCFKSDERSRHTELANIFREVRLCSLSNCFPKNKINDQLMSEISILYTYVIAASLYFRRKDPGFHKMIEEVKAQTPYIPALQLLERIGITANDLVTTSKDVKKLILEKG